MKWLTDPPDDWDSAPEEPPAGTADDASVRSELLVNGVVVREPGSTEAYLYTSDGATPVEDNQ
jgi:hypothetical protein